MYPKEKKSTYQSDHCIPVFIAAIFTTSKWVAFSSLWQIPEKERLKEEGCSLADEQ